MQTNEKVDQVRQLARLPEMEGVANSKRPALEGRAKRPAAGPRAGAGRQQEVAVGPGHNPRRYGAGF